MRAFNWILLALSAIKNVRIDEFVRFLSLRDPNNGTVSVRFSQRSRLPFFIMKLVAFCWKNK